MITRRSFLECMGGSLGPLLFAGCAAQNPHLNTADWIDPDTSQFPVYGLTQSASGEYDFEARIVGGIPKDLRGTLYRNGPGLFQRGNRRKRCLLDGDGMIQAFSFAAGSVRFRNRFVRTQKYIEESRQGRFIFPTWSTQAHGSISGNMLGPSILSQANITVSEIGNKLYAFDENQKPYEMDFHTLDTITEATLGMPGDYKFFSAHSKVDGQTGERFLFGLEQGARTTLHLLTLDSSGCLTRYRKHVLPWPTYIHDFFASERFLVFNFHPVQVNFLEYLSGQKSFLDSMSWRPGDGNWVWVFDRASDQDPLRFQTDACWMWHSINAFEDKDVIVADFIGYHNPDHILGAHPALVEIMKGRRGSYEFPGEIHRYVIELKPHRLHHDKIVAGSYEFPCINSHNLCHPYRFGYCAVKPQADPFFTGIARIDFTTCHAKTFIFNSNQFCGEPIFVPQPGHHYDAESIHEPGWILVEVYDAGTHHKSLAVFEAESLTDGPTTWIHFDRYLPLGLHGFWKQA